MIVTILDDLEEATPFEHVFGATLLERIERFKIWLAARDEENILVVGHSQYFKKMLGLTTLMRNCDVWRCDFTSEPILNNEATCGLSAPTATYEWTNLNLLHRTELSDIHPYDKMMNEKNENEKNKKNENENIQIGDDVYNDLHPDEPSCRICQVSGVLLFIPLVAGHPGVGTLSVS